MRMMRTVELVDALGLERAGQGGAATTRGGWRNYCGLGRHGRRQGGGGKARGHELGRKNAELWSTCNGLRLNVILP